MSNAITTATKNDVTIQVDTTQGNWNNATFPKTAKISEVIQAVVKKFSFAPDGKYQLAFASDPGTPLKPDRTLVSYDVKDGTVLIFTEMGGGV